MKKIVIHIQPKQTGLPNPMHLEVQQKTRMNVFKPKKGKGSFKRRSKYKNNYMEELK